MNDYGRVKQDVLNPCTLYDSILCVCKIHNYPSCQFFIFLPVFCVNYCVTQLEKFTTSNHVTTKDNFLFSYNPIDKLIKTSTNLYNDINCKEMSIKFCFRKLQRNTIVIEQRQTIVLIGLMQYTLVEFVIDKYLIKY